MCILFKCNINMYTLSFRYFGHPRPASPDVDVLQWWKTNENVFPLLAQMARQILAVPASSSSSERMFSTAGQVLSDLRQNMTPGLTSKLVFIKKNFGKLETDLAKWSYKTKAELEELKVMWINFNMQFYETICIFGFKFSKSLPYFFWQFLQNITLSKIGNLSKKEW